MVKAAGSPPAGWRAALAVLRDQVNTAGGGHATNSNLDGAIAVPVIDAIEEMLLALEDCPLPKFWDDVVAERVRQISVEGYDAAHDDAHAADMSLAIAAGAYALAAAGWRSAPMIWPWELEGFKASMADRRRSLEKAGAFILAAGEAFDRNPDVIPPLVLNSPPPDFARVLAVREAEGQR